MRDRLIVLRSSLSRVGFFKRGVTAAFFRELGIWLIKSDLFITDVMQEGQEGSAR